MPVSFAEGEHHHGEDVGYRCWSHHLCSGQPFSPHPHRQYGLTYPTSPPIEQRPRDRTDGELQKGAQTPDPRDIVRGLVRELVRQVVFLERAEGIDETQTAEEDGEAAGGAEPSFQAAVWGGRVGGDGVEGIGVFGFWLGLGFGVGEGGSVFLLHVVFLGR